MEWLQAIDYVNHAINKSLTFSVVQAAESDFPSEVLIIVGVTPGATKGAFLRDFNGERGLLTL